MTTYWLWTVGFQRGVTPHRIKQRIVKEYARHYGLRILVETGTYFGDMAWALRHDFDELHSVELDQTLCDRARRRFAKYAHVHIYHGDSAAVLPIILARLNGPALFWLDAHLSGGITAQGEQVTPIRAELGHVLGSANHPHIVLIDDARLFTGRDGYPSVGQLHDQIETANRDDVLTIRDDVIRISAMDVQK